MLVLITLIIIGLDQATKYAAVKYLKNKEPQVIVKKFLNFHYVENSGAAFGILQHKKVFFIIMTSIVIIYIAYFLFKNSHNLNKWMEIFLVMLMGGAIGNLIDRIRLGYVIDFISVRLGKGYNFPVFNIADISIVVATFCITFMILSNKYEI